MNSIITKILTTLTFAFLFCSVSVSASTPTPVQPNENSVFYRISDGKKTNVYVIDIGRNYLRNIVDTKINIWKSFQQCESTSKVTFVDAVFQSDKSTYNVNDACLLIIKNDSRAMACKMNYLAINYVINSLKYNLEIGYGAEYQTPVENSYFESNCTAI